MFSPELLDKLQAEAEAAGLKGATPISLAVRADLMERKRVGRVPDGRTATYWARLTVEGEFDTGWAKFDGLPAISGQLDAWGYELSGPVTKAARVALARFGEYGVKLGNALVTIRNTAP